MIDTNYYTIITFWPLSHGYICMVLYLYPQIVKNKISKYKQKQLNLIWSFYVQKLLLKKPIISYLIKCPNLYVGVHMLQNFKNILMTGIYINIVDMCII